jgi:L-rhamnose mutarotase
MERYGMVVEILEDKIDEYKRLHAAIWPGVARRIRECHIQNYSIYLKKLPDGKHYLFSYFEYVGADFAADGEKMAADPEVQRWWAVCKPCLRPLPGITMEECWCAMEEVFHQD